MAHITHQSEYQNISGVGISAHGGGAAAVPLCLPAAKAWRHMPAYLPAPYQPVTVLCYLRGACTPYETAKRLYAWRGGKSERRQKVSP